MAKFIEIKEGIDNLFLLNLDTIKFITPSEDGTGCLVFFIGEPYPDGEEESIPQSITTISYLEMKKMLGI